MLRRVVSWELIDVSEVIRPDDGGSKHLWNAGQFLWHYKA
jgi:hypothetical protein